MRDAEQLRRLAVALDLAVRAHEGQRRRDGRREPFVNHVADVARRVADSPEVDEVTLLAALLHDVAEKTSHGLPEIERAFGAEVAGVVAALTDDESLPKGERHRQQVARAPTMPSAAKRVKLADKASKLAGIAASPPGWWRSKAKARRELKKAREVAAALRGADSVLEAAFDREAEAVERVLAGQLRESG
jgi:(p)ppGpp synthase/HD superfamily hydrolase